MGTYSDLFFQENEYYDIPPFRFPIYHDLVAGEAEGVESIARKQAQNTYSLLRIAKALSKKKKVSIKEALDILSESDSNNDTFYEYADQLAEVQEKSSTVAEEQIEVSTLFLRFRGELKCDGKWVQISDWTRDDTLSIPSKTLTKITDFINWERNGWPEEGK